MYIVNQGKVQVVGGTERNEVLAELGPGSVFGEIRYVAIMFYSALMMLKV